MNSIRKLATSIAKKNIFLRNIMRGTVNFMRLLRYKMQTFYISTDTRTVIFASFGGTSYSDNPKALFEFMVRSGRFDDHTFVWGFTENVPERRLEISKRMKDLRGEGAADIKVMAVRFNSAAWRKYTAKAGYWILNYKTDDYLRPKKDQVFIQTWHGTPFKRLGFDLEHFDSALNTKKGMQKRYGKETRKFTWFLSPSKFASEKFRSAWRMDAFNKGNILLETGYPRNDVLFHHSDEQVRRIRQDVLGEYCDTRKKIILYAPTYRADQYKSGGFVYKEKIDFEKLKARLNGKYMILFRAHYFVTNGFDLERFKGFVFDVSGFDDISDLYLISDMLITDYSSSMFDYANLKRPMIFYMYDLEHYRDESNGFYFDPEEVLPGPIVKNDDALIDAILKLGDEFIYDEKYRRFNKIFDQFDDGCACSRVIDRVFRGIDI